MKRKGSKAARTSGTRGEGANRHNARRPLAGAVVLTFEDPDPVEIAGELIELGEGGFRLAHFHSTLRAGQRVQFHHVAIQGTARVMWTRNYPGHAESGFRILEE